MASRQPLSARWLHCDEHGAPAENADLTSARGEAFSGLKAEVMQSKPATWQGQLTGGQQTVIRYVDPVTGQTKFTVHTVTDSRGFVVHRDFDSVLISSGQQVGKVH